MDPLSIAVGAVAAALGIFRLLTMLKVRINASTLLEVLQKLIRTGNITRAIKLCNAAPNGVLTHACRAGLLVSGQRDESVEERRSRVIEAYAAARDERMARLGKQAPFGWVAAVLGALAIAVGATSTPPTPLAVGLGLLATTTTGFAIVAFSKLRREARIVGDGLIEALLKHWRSEGGGAAPSDPKRAKEIVDKIGAELGLAGPKPSPPRPSPQRPSDSRPSDAIDAPADTRVAPIRPAPVADMRAGACSLCAAEDIADVADPARAGFRIFVCRSCGFAQTFASDPAAH